MTNLLHEEPDEPYAIRTKGVYDPRKGAIGKGVVVVADDRVRQIRDDVPNDVPVIYDHDGYAIPGLVDAHSHASVRPWEGNQIGQIGGDRVTTAVRSVTNLRTDLEAGTTTMRLMAEEGYLGIRLAEAEHSGELDAPRLLPSGVHLTPTGGHGMVETPTDGREDIRRRIRENVWQGATHTKCFATGGVSSDTGPPGRPMYTREEIREIVTETHRLQKPVAAHAHGGEGARIAIDEGVDTIEHASLFGDEEIDRLGDDQFVVATFAIGSHPQGIETGDADNPAIMAKLRESRERSEAAWRAILDADVAVAAGTDSMHGYLHYEVAKLVEYGASSETALDAVTLAAARCVRLDDEVGSVESGKRADLVCLDGNPLEGVEVLADPVAVFKDGHRVA